MTKIFADLSPPVRDTGLKVMLEILDLLPMHPRSVDLLLALQTAYCAGYTARETSPLHSA